MDINELIQKAQEHLKPKTKKNHQNKSVIKFIEYYELEEGTKLVPTYIIFNEYIKWAKDFSYKSTSNVEFFRTFVKFFSQKRKKLQRYYKLNYAFNYTDAEMKELKSRLFKQNERWQNTVENEKNIQP